MHTLVVDDEENIRFFLQEALKKSGHQVTALACGEDALELLRETFFDLAVLDLNLGGKIDGLRVLEAIRWRWPETVVVILTGHGSLQSAMSAIEEGVDGYLLKPLDANELRQAIETIMRRAKHRSSEPGPADQDLLQHGEISLDTRTHQVQVGERSIQLTPHEFTLLAYMVKNANRVLTPLELVAVVQGYTLENEQEAREIIKWYIHRLRKKIELCPAAPSYLLNVRGVGYILGKLPGNLPGKLPGSLPEPGDADA